MWVEGSELIFVGNRFRKQSWYYSSSFSLSKRNNVCNNVNGLVRKNLNGTQRVIYVGCVSIKTLVVLVPYRHWRSCNAGALCLPTPWWAVLGSRYPSTMHTNYPGTLVSNAPRSPLYPSRNTTNSSEGCGTGCLYMCVCVCVCGG